MEIREIIKKTAIAYVGQEEIKGNQGWQDKAFEEKMITVGFKPGEAWCALFAELVWKEAYQQYNAFEFQRLDKLFSKSAVRTFTNFKLSSNKFTKVPNVGALVAWQKFKGGKEHWTGHIGVVVDILTDGNFSSVEGNSNPNGGREGTHVVIKKRKLDFSLKPDGLNLLGFITPQEA